MSIVVETVNDLATCLQDGGYRRIGIDGYTGCGKSTLAKSLSKSLDLDFISIDDYLDRTQGSYFAHLKA